MHQKNPKDKAHRGQRFLKLPSYPGGKQAFLKFVEDNMMYPETALENKIEGTVYLEYTVDNIGTVGDIVITHGIGSGCDEEAVRLIRMLRYDPEKNKGVRMKTRMKSRIRFELPSHLKPPPGLQLNYITPAVKESPGPTSDDKSGYGYTLTIDS
jgi:protein TonB